MEIKNHRPGWSHFIRDFGDALGGVSVGYAIGNPNGLGYGLLGVTMILISVYLRFYHNKREPNG